MNPRPTPETDKIDLELSNDSFLEAYEGMLFFARKLERERDDSREQAAAWKANHDNQVKLKATLMDRPDLGDRAMRMAALIADRDEACAEASQLKVANERLVALAQKYAIDAAMKGNA